MPRNIVKTLEKNFSDMKAGDRMLISSPEEISEYIARIPEGETRTQKRMRFDLARDRGADNTCPVSTGIFLRMAVEQVLGPSGVEASPLPFWRLVDEKHPVLKKLGIPASDIARMRKKEACA